MSLLPAMANAGSVGHVGGLSTWAHVDGWDQDVVAAVQDSCGIDIGRICLPARPGVTTARAALLDLLTALGKTATAGGQPGDAPLAHACAAAWLAGEAISTIFLLSAQRWPPAALRSIDAVTAEEGVKLVAVTTERPSAELGALLASACGPAVSPAVALASQPPSSSGPSLPSPPGVLRRLRRCRMPYMPAAYVACAAGAGPEQLTFARCGDLSVDGRRLQVGDSEIVVPEGCGRFLLAQHRYASRNAASALFSRGRSPTTAADIVFASMVAAREADLELPPALA